MRRERASRDPTLPPTRSPATQQSPQPFLRHECCVSTDILLCAATLTSGGSHIRGLGAVGSGWKPPTQHHALDTTGLLWGPSALIHSLRALSQAGVPRCIDETLSPAEQRGSRPLLHPPKEPRPARAQHRFSPHNTAERSASPAAPHPHRIQGEWLEAFRRRPHRRPAVRR